MADQQKWDAFVQDCRSCVACELAGGRKNVVVSRGALDARLALIGEGPGADEDEQGLPFVGRSGRLLSYLLMANGLFEEHYHVCNIVKCRPPGNRKPLPAEAAACAPLLERQLAMVKPKLALLLGASAFGFFTGQEESISRARGRFFEHNGLLVLPTFHPAYILRNNAMRIHLWNDVVLLRNKMEELGLIEPLRFAPDMPLGRP